MKATRELFRIFPLCAQVHMTFRALGVVLASATLLRAQDTQPTAATPERTPLTLTWQDGARDACSTEKLAMEPVTDTITGEVTNRLHRYVQVASGLNYLDDAGQWQPSREVIELMPDGSAAAVHGRIKAYFAPNLNTPGAITLITSSNRVFKTHIAGLYFYNAATGARQQIALPSDCAAKIVAPNQIVYRSLFQSPKADLRVTYTRAAIETDLILLQSPKPPDAASAGVTRLELWHEYLNSPTPERWPRVVSSVADLTLRSSMVEPDLVDETLDFGDLWYPMGSAFSASVAQSGPTNVAARITLGASASGSGVVCVAKRWVVSDDSTRTFLVESVNWLDIKPQMDGLQTAGVSPRLSRPKDKTNGGICSLPPKLATRKAARPVQLASRGYRPAGLIWDYVTVQSDADYRFLNGTTYYVESAASFSGTVTFESGCVLKYATGAYLLSSGYGSFVFSIDTNYPPPTFTSKDDDLFGVGIDGSSGVPTYAAAPALYPYAYYSANTPSIQGVRIRWAQTGVEYVPGYYNNWGSFNDSALELCQTGLRGDGNFSVIINNSTQCSVSTPVDSSSVDGSLTDICSGDSDSNGLPDAWEYQHFGHIGVDPNADPDADGLSNIMEYRLGTNPSKPFAQDANGSVRLQVYTPLK